VIYLKTYFYVEHEIQFLIANLKEAYPHIEKFIINEFNRTHTGMPREMIGWDRLKAHIPDSLIDKVLYMPVDISRDVVAAYDDEETIHRVNEPVMRSIFMKNMAFNDSDIIVSIDADEIIYGDTYPKIKEFLERQSCCSLNLHQFFYKKTYLWKNKDFVAPTAAKYSYFKNSYPCNLRYEGQVLPGKSGCHFSWCMTVSEMIYKLHTYSHPQFRFCANEELLTNAINEKIYPFDLTEKFEIEELTDDSYIIPKSIKEI